MASAPVAIAMTRSIMFGFVLSSIAPLSSSNGERRLTAAATAMDSTMLTVRRETDSRKKRAFCLTIESDDPRIGHMRGAMIMAPITTERLSAMSPRVAMTVERSSKIKYRGEKDDSFLTAAITFECSRFLRILNMLKIVIPAKAGNHT